MSGEFPAKFGICPCCHRAHLTQFVPREDVGRTSGERMVPVMTLHLTADGRPCPGGGDISTTVATVAGAPESHAKETVH